MVGLASELDADEVEELLWELDQGDQMGGSGQGKTVY